MKHKKSSIIVSIILILLVSITVGYAFLNGKLNITGNSQIKENSWVIYFDNLVEKEDDNSVVPTENATITNFEKTQIDFSVSLTKPGDKYEFIVDIRNDGSIDAVIDSVTKTGLDEETSKYLDFDVTYVDKDNTPLQHCDLLEAQSYRKVKAIVQFKKDITEEDLSKEAVNLNLSFSINYVQSTACDTPTILPNAYLLYIDPDGGEYTPSSDETFNERLGLYEKVLELGEEFTLGTATKENYLFNGWDAINNNGFTTNFNSETNTITMDQNNAYIKAKYAIEGDYIARINQTYYETIQAAFDAAKEGDMIYLLGDTEESPTNYTNADITLNLDGFRVTGTLTNEGTLTLVNLNKDRESYFINEEGYGAINNGTFTLGINDEEVKQDGIALIGNATDGGIGLKQNGTFNFYDGYLEGYIALDGTYHSVPKERYVFIDHNDEKDCQRGYLIEKLDRAVARITSNNNTNVYYYNLQDSLIVSQATGLTTYAIRDFAAPYALSVEENKEAVFDLDGYTVETGSTITNNGTFTITNNKETGELKPSQTITNNGALNFENVIVNETTTVNIIDNYKNINIVNSTLSTKSGSNANVIYNYGSGSIISDDTSYLNATNYAIANYNNEENGLIVQGGTLAGIYNTGNLIMNEGTKIIKESSIEKVYGVYNYGSHALFTMNGGLINITNTKSNRVDYVYFSAYGIYNEKTPTNIINGGNIKTATQMKDKNGMAYNIYGGKNTINGGIFESNKIDGYSSSAYNFYLDRGDSLTINKNEDETKSPVIKSNATCIYAADSGTTTINGGTLECGNYGYDEYRFGHNTLIMNGGSIKSTYTAICKDDYNNMTITGGSIVSTNNNGIYFDPMNESNLTINSSSMPEGEHTYIEGYTNGIYAGSKGNLYIENAEIVGKTGDGINTQMLTYVYGGTITSETGYGINTSSTLNIGKNNGDISITDPVIQGNLYGLYKKSGTVNMYDGILKGITEGVYGEINGFPDGYTLKDDEETIEEATYQTSYLVLYINFVKVGDQEYNSLNKAIDAINETGTMELIASADIKASTTIPASKNITLDLAGYTLNVSKQIVNNGTFTIQDSSETKSGGITYNFQNLIYNNNLLNIKSGNFNGPNTFIYNNAKEIVIDGGIITISGNAEKVFGIYNYGVGKITMNDGTIDVTNTKNIDKAYYAYGIYNYSYYSNYNYYISTTIINGGTINTTSTNAYNDYSYASNIYVYGGNVTINGGTFKVNGNGNYAQNVINFYVSRGSSDGSLTINKNEDETKNPVIKSNKTCIMATSETTTINGGTLECENYGFYGTEHSVLVMNGGSIKSTYTAIYKSSYNEVTITGGKIISTNNNGIYFDPLNEHNLTINSNSMPEGEYTYIEGYTNGVYLGSKGKLYIENAEIVGKQGDGIKNYYKSYVYSGKITSEKGYGINTSGTLTLGKNDGNVSITNPIIQGNLYGLYINSGTVNMYDGISYGSEKGISGFVSGFPDGYTLKEEEKTIEETTYQTSYLVPYINFVKVGDQEYNSLNKAIDAINETGTMELIASADIKASTTIPASKNITLDLAGYTLNVSKQIVNNGTFTIQDSSETKSGGITYNFQNLIYNNNLLNIKSGNFNGPNTFIFNNHKNVVMDGGTITISGDAEKIYGVYNYGASTFTMNGGTIDVTNTRNIDKSSNAYSIYNESYYYEYKYYIETTIINGGKIKTTSTNSYNDYGNANNIRGGKVTINSGTFEVDSTGQAYNMYLDYSDDLITINKNEDETKNPVIKSNKTCIYAYNGTATINGGTLECGNYGFYGTSHGTLVMNGGSIKSTYSAIYKGTYNGITITGGRIVSTNNNGIYFDTINEYNLIINSNSMSEGEYTYIEGYTNGIYTGSKDKLYIEDAEIVGKTGDGIKNNYQAYVYSGKITSETGYGINTSGTLTIGKNDEDVSITNPVIQGNLYGLYINSGTTNFYDGILKGTNGGYYGTFSSIPTDTLIHNDEETIDETKYITTYLQTQKNIILNINNNTEYKNVQTALNEANNGDTLEFLDNINLYDEITIPDKNITIDMKGKYLKPSKTIINNGTVNIVDSSTDKASYIISNLVINVFINNKVLIIDDIDITHTSTSSSVYPFTNNNEAVLTLDNLTLTSGYFGINNTSGGTLNINNSTLTSNNVSIKDYGEIHTYNLTITGSVYGIYSDTTTDSDINNTTVTNNNEYRDNNFSIYKTNKVSNMVMNNINIQNGYLYNYSNMNITGGTINDYIYNDTRELDITDVNISHHLDTAIYNNGTLNVDHTTINTTYSDVHNYYGIKNNQGDLTISNSEITMNKNYNYTTTNYCIYSVAGNITSTNNTYTINDLTTDSYKYNKLYVISNEGSSKIISNSDTINSNGRNEIIGIFNISSNTENEVTSLTTNIKNASTEYGIYNKNSTITLKGNNNINVSDSTNVSYGINVNSGTVTFESGNISVAGPTAHGAYINNTNAILNLGILDGSNTGDAQVSITDPLIQGIGTNTGIGVNKVNGIFNYYDGKVIGNTDSIPATASVVEPGYEVTKYYDSVKKFEYAILEYMKGDYKSVAASIGSVRYTSLQLAINKATSEDTIILYKNLTENITIPSGKTINLDLNNKILTSEITNNGTLNVYNGTISKLETTPIKNYGDLIIGKDDGTVSNNIVIIGKDIGVQNEGTFYMYDGSIKANTPLNGTLTGTAEGYTSTIIAEDGTNKLHLIEAVKYY